MAGEPNLEPKIQRKNLSEGRIEPTLCYSPDILNSSCADREDIYFSWNKILPRLKIISVKVLRILWQKLQVKSKKDGGKDLALLHVLRIVSVVTLFCFAMNFLYFVAIFLHFAVGFLYLVVNFLYCAVFFSILPWVFFILLWFSIFCSGFSLHCRELSLFCCRFLYSAVIFFILTWVFFILPWVCLCCRDFSYIAVILFFLPWQLWATVVYWYQCSLIDLLI